ncbi:hypothetical protein GI075_11205 [Salmonella enterica]|uniref:hypothetical protein n=1 Tax=Salmonella enterica TaxID=28901 RepID=UPI0009ACE245|nr:hypothetical protein [Salmonella enterica]EDK2264244.1 hypothetical protein [Salmonella enterica subsp. enterica serovar Muenchen]EAR8245922.1 hypothetical protein [Salmonella enterica]EAT6373672.1 hypothetical protein [Salmonella enterica]EBI8206263.1 hypothetical protein [Salmonella enterica]ECC0514167.1 hypothetical protein [Salmonella enterica]
MKYLIKGAEPRGLISWKAVNQQTPQNLKYGTASFPAETVRCALLQQQNYLCAYTLIRLKRPEECDLNHKTRESCHIEHILPQTREVLVAKKLAGLPVKNVVNFTAGEDIDFNNMVACFPPSVAMIHCDFGAQYKGDYDPYDNPNFISPLTASVEVHFKFLSDGSIEAQSAKGEETISALNLNHIELCHRRERVLTGTIYPRGKKRPSISAAEARRLADEVLRPNADGRLREFCVAIRHVALSHADRLERRARRTAGQSRR